MHQLDREVSKACASIPDAFHVGRDNVLWAFGAAGAQPDTQARWKQFAG